MKSLADYIKEAQEVALTSYIKELRKEYVSGNGDEDIYLNVSAKLFKYLDSLSDNAIKSLCSQLHLGDENDDRETNKSHILLYVTNV